MCTEQAVSFIRFQGIISDGPLDGPPDVFFLDTFRNGGEGQSFGVRVGLSHPSLEQVRATITPESLSAVFGQDFELHNSQGIPVDSVELFFQPGEQERQVTVRLVQDGVSEPREVYNLRISSAIGANVESPDTFVGWINDDIPSGDVELTFIESPEIGPEGSTVHFLVGLTAPSESVVSAALVTQDLGATAGADYALQTTMVEFQPGTSSNELWVTYKKFRLPD